jgi:hypothetical protein
MTPKEKAKELLDKMQLDWACDSCHNDWTKECALISVDEMIKQQQIQFEEMVWSCVGYWKDVKQEILAL